MTRKVILDVDPGIDDAVAICLALFDPRLEVVAITATGGNVSPQQATVNVQTIVEQLDPPRWPRLGAAPLDNPLPADNRQMHGSDGLGNANFPVASLHNMHPAEKVICDEVRAAPNEVTIICLGPLTNISRAMHRDPDLLSLLGGLIICGGAVGVSGNVTAAAEFNVFCDPLAARWLFRAPLTKTLVPLDCSRQYSMTLDQFDQLPPETTRAGKFLRQILPCSFRSYRQNRGMESIYLSDVVTLVAATDPELFELEGMAGDVEIDGEITTGATVFDRRQEREWRNNMDVAMTMQKTDVRDKIIGGLIRAGELT